MKDWDGFLWTIFNGSTYSDCFTAEHKCLRRRKFWQWTAIAPGLKSGLAALPTLPIVDWKMFPVTCPKYLTTNAQRY
jgi:hypothetical protein